METGLGNVYYQTDLSYGDKTELFFKNTITPPDVGVACLDFKYRKFSKGEVYRGTILSFRWCRWTEVLDSGGGLAVSR